MKSNDYLEVDGIVTKKLKGGKFEVQVTLPNKDVHTVNCTLSGKLMTNSIRVLLGDSVKVEMSVYDLSKGRISWRNR